MIFCGHRVLSDSNIKEYLSAELSLEHHEILLIGSAKTGFSFSTKSFGRKFSGKSDLDFTIISETLFDALERDYHTWRELFEKKAITPQHHTEENFWISNIDNLRSTCQRGFIDTYKLPNRDCCKTAKAVNNSLYLITQRLKSNFGYEEHKASARVYRDTAAFLRQLHLNTGYLKTLIDKDANDKRLQQ